MDFTNATDIAVMESTKMLPSKQAIRVAARKHKKETLALLIKQHNLEFTYIRNEDEDGTKYRFGGAVVCWQMPAKPSARMIPVSIAWCHDNEVFDKLHGRYYSALNFVEGKRVVFKLLPSTDGISIRIKDVFENGFMV